jgi:hypothetical protein
MKILIALLIVLAVGFVGWKVYERWDETSREQDLKQAAGPADPRSIPGMDHRLENSLEEAQRGGAKGLGAWLDKNRRSPYLKDPRLAWIELDYAVLLSSEDPAQSRKIFAQVKERVPPDSPVFQRVQQLQKTFE